MAPFVAVIGILAPSVALACPSVDVRGPCVCYPFVTRTDPQWRFGGFDCQYPRGLLVVRFRWRHEPMQYQSHVGLVDPEAERGAYTIEMRSLWGFDAQVASGKLRECAGCAPQVDTLDRQW